MMPRKTKREKLTTRRAWRKRNREKIREWFRLWRKNFPEKAHKCRIDAERGAGAYIHYQKQLKQQKKRCAICSRKLSNTMHATRASFDHNHKTGQWRGALCIQCNVGIGNFSENPKDLLKAVAYIKKWARQDAKLNQRARRKP